MFTLEQLCSILFCSSILLQLTAILFSIPFFIILTAGGCILVFALLDSDPVLFIGEALALFLLFRLKKVL